VTALIRRLPRPAMLAVQILLIVAVLLAPVAISWAGQRDLGLGPQYDVAPAPVVIQAGYTSGGPASSLLILSYHNIEPNPSSRYSVTPAEFASQLQLLHAAGYRTVRAADLLAARRPAGRRVAITFDDGARGQWAYADRVLARYGFTAISFLLTGSVGSYPPYYLTWPQVQQMRVSGRWDFESHTHALITPVVIGPHGETGSPLFNRRWLPGPGRLEAMPEYETRIAADLDASRHALTSRGLPAARLFSLPVVARTPNDERVAASLRSVARSRFGAVLRDQPDVRPVTTSDLTSGVLPRVSVRSGTTAAALFSRLTGAPAPSVSPSPSSSPSAVPAPGPAALPAPYVIASPSPLPLTPAPARQPVPVLAVRQAAGSATVEPDDRPSWPSQAFALVAQAWDDLGLASSSPVTGAGPKPAGDTGAALAGALVSPLARRAG
jgi:hypothetical protein